MKKHGIVRVMLLTLFLMASLVGWALPYTSFIVNGYGYKILSEEDRTVSLTNEAQRPTKVYNSLHDDVWYISETIYYTGEIVIPETVTYDGITYTVTAIENATFGYGKSYNCEMTSLSIPKTIATLPKCMYLFSKCIAMKSLILEDSDEQIDFDSWDNTLTTLDSLYMGRNIKNHYQSYFKTIKSLTVGEKVTDITYGLCSSNPNLQHVVLGQNVSTISDMAFKSCTSLKSINLPAQLKEIKISAFSECGLTRISIPNSVDSIYRDAFTNCAQLEEVVIEDGDKRLGLASSNSCSSSPTFSGCPIKKVYLGRNTSFVMGNSIPVFPNALEEVTIGDKVTRINAEFAYNTNLSTVKLGKGLTSLGSSAFRGIAFEHIELPQSLTYIDDYAFAECKSLKSIELPIGVKSISYRIFYNCTALESVILPADATYLGGKLFEGCKSLKSISVPGKVTEIGYYAFDGCISLKDVVFEDGEQDLVLESYNVSTTFNQCPIDSVYLGRNLKKKKDSGSTYYYYNSLFPASLTKLTIGSNVTTQWDYRTFQNCSELTHVHPLWEQPISTNKNMFPDAIYTNATLLVPGGTVKKYQATAAWNEFANIVPTAIGVTMTATAGGSISLGDVTVTDDTQLLQEKPNSVLTFEITPEETHFLESLVMNETDVTSQVVNGQFTPTDLSEDIELTATFTAKPYYSVTATASTGGTATVGSASVMWGNGTTVTLTADEGYELKEVTVNGTDKTSEVVDGVLTLSDIQENKTVVATFQKQRFAVTAAECENGSISLSASEVEWDASATATFTPAAHYEVATVSVNGEDRTAQLSNNQLTIANIRQATTVGATFRLQTFTVTETHNEGGTVLLSAETAPWGSSVTVTITPDDEHFMEHVTVNGVDVTADVTNGEYAITVESSTAVAVTFVAKPYYSVTATSTAGGTATVGSASVMWGRSTTVTLTPDECYELVSVTVNGVDKTSEVEDGVLTLDDIQEDMSVDATFGIKTATITISAAGQGTYCSDHDLDFSGIVGLKAYIASGFIRQTGTVILLRVTDVPAREGLMVKGEPGTYKVPYAESTAYYVNMLKGNVEAVNVAPTEGDYTNYYLSNGSNGLGFYHVSSTLSMGANRAILQLPTVMVNGARALNIVYDDDELTGVGNAPRLTNKDATNNDPVYNLKGQRVANPAKGLYIQNGKKIIIK